MNNCNIFPNLFAPWLYVKVSLVFFIILLEIPEWLQVYAKASPDFDEFLKVSIS